MIVKHIDSNNVPKDIIYNYFFANTGSTLELGPFLNVFLNVWPSQTKENLASYI